ncbi:MAG: DegT/DnrJ/EryC1/StrS family aminotransferase [Planctomycetota bacterium]
MTTADTAPTTPAAASDSAASTLAIHGGSPVCDPAVPFMKPQLQPQDVAAAHAVLESGMLRAASKCSELETRFAEASDASHALTCANGTCALQLAYHAIGLKPGDHVIVPAWTYVATASMLVAQGVRPIFCDSLPGSYQIDVEDARKRITPETKAIACTHIYGIPVDIDAVQALAAEHSLKVVYDCAQAHLATYNGKGIGAFGDVCTYSFYATKNLGTGEGGIVTTNDDTLATDIGLLRSHGETEKYLHERIGFNYRMNDITGAIGCSRLTRLLDETNARRAAAKLYEAIVAGIEGLGQPEPTPGSEPAWHLYSVKLDLDKFSCTRDEFCDALRAEGVPTAVHYPKCLTDQPAFADVIEANGRDYADRFGGGSAGAERAAHPPVSRRLASQVFSLPMHHELTKADTARVGEALAKVTAAFRN